MMNSTTRKIFMKSSSIAAARSSMKRSSAVAPLSSLASTANNEQSSSSSSQWLTSAAMLTAAAVGVTASTNYENSRKTTGCFASHHSIIGVTGDEGALMLEETTPALPLHDKLAMAPPEEYQHWTEKDIMEQPEAIGRTLGFGRRVSREKVMLNGLDQNEHKLRNIQHMILSGCEGTSLNSSKYGECLMNYMGSFDSVKSIDTSATREVETSDDGTMNTTGMIVVSELMANAENEAVAQVVNSAMDKGVTVMSVANAIGNMIANLNTSDNNEVQQEAVASSTAFATQVTVLAMVALWFREIRDRLAGAEPSQEEIELKECLIRLPIAMGMSLGRTSKKQCKEIAERFANKRHCFVLGAGFAQPVAQEGAQKIKEMCSIDSRAQLGCLPIDTPIIMIILDDEDGASMRAKAEEIKATGTEIFVITDKPELAAGLDEDPIMIQRNGPVTALGAVLPLQLIAYELAMARGINPDAPRQS